jgi:hypothetical protein
MWLLRGHMVIPSINDGNRKWFLRSESTSEKTGL